MWKIVTCVDFSYYIGAANKEKGIFAAVHTIIQAEVELLHDSSSLRAKIEKKYTRLDDNFW